MPTGHSTKDVREQLPTGVGADDDMGLGPDQGVAGAPADGHGVRLAPPACFSDAPPPPC